MAVARVTLMGRLAGQRHKNVLHFHKGDIVTADLPDLAARVRDWWLDNPLAANLSAALAWDNVHVAIMESSFVPIDFAVSVHGVFADNGHYSPVLAACFQLLTPTAGRRGRGRHYVGAQTTEFMNAGVWNVFWQNRLDAIAQAFQDFWTDPNNPNYKGNGWTLAVCPRNDATQVKFVTRVRARPMAGFIQRRQLGRGE